MTTERILCAAVFYPSSRRVPSRMQSVESGICVTGYKHSDAKIILKYFMKGLDESYEETKIVEGFMTNQCRFVGRGEATQIAKTAGQMDKSLQMILTSEILNQ